jgi:multiple sugar transport system substrate-binding protein
LSEFGQTSGVKINVTRLPWKDAWQKLLTVAIEGKGADVSHVGSTWAPTLAALDSLRPFNESEIRSLGGPLIFVPAAWQTVQIEGRGEVWAIPWSVYTFVIFYRRDLLQEAGIEESTAFLTPESIRETFSTLQRAGIPPWAMPTQGNYLDLPHIAVSWLRACGGDFFGPDGRTLEFNRPHVRKGLVEFFELYRFIPADLRGLDYDTCQAAFFGEGRMSVLVAGPEAYSDALDDDIIPEGNRELVGVAALPAVSWIGGDHLVIWKTVRIDAYKEKSAVELIRSLISIENQKRLFRQSRILPARLEAYTDLEFQPVGMRPVLEKVLQTARPHPPARLWRRTESMLVDMLNEIAKDVLDSEKADIEEIVEHHCEDSAKRISLFIR